MGVECLERWVELERRQRHVEGVHEKKADHGDHEENPRVPQDQDELYAELVTLVAGTSADDPGASASALETGGAAFAFALEASAREAVAGLQV
jgi:hypothetical protein